MEVNDTRTQLFRGSFENDSLDRFGDDLIELIVGNLTIEDKFKFECLSKRIQCLIFNKQYLLKTNLIDKFFPHKAFGGFSYKKLQEVLSKLKSLTKIEFDGKVLINSQIIKFIVDLCPHLRHITIDKFCITSELTTHCIEYFGRKCGPNLKSFYGYKEVDKNVAKLLKCASNLVTLKVNKLSDLTRNQPDIYKTKAHHCHDHSWKRIVYISGTISLDFGDPNYCNRLDSDSNQ